jgi:hypothetical protein
MKTLLLAAAALTVLSVLSASAAHCTDREDDTLHGVYCRETHNCSSEVEEAHSANMRCSGTFKRPGPYILIFDENHPYACSIQIDQAGECGEIGVIACTVVGRVLYSRWEHMYGGKVKVYYLKPKFPPEAEWCKKDDPNYSYIIESCKE